MNVDRMMSKVIEAAAQKVASEDFMTPAANFEHSASSAILTEIDDASEEHSHLAHG